MVETIEQVKSQLSELEDIIRNSFNALLEKYSVRQASMVLGLRPPEVYLDDPDLVMLEFFIKGLKSTTCLVNPESDKKPALSTVKQKGKKNQKKEAKLQTAKQETEEEVKKEATEQQEFWDFEDQQPAEENRQPIDYSNYVPEHISKDPLLARLLVEDIWNIIANDAEWNQQNKIVRLRKTKDGNKQAIKASALLPALHNLPLRPWGKISNGGPMTSTLLGRIMANSEWKHVLEYHAQTYLMIARLYHYIEKIDETTLPERAKNSPVRILRNGIFRQTRKYAEKAQKRSCYRNPEMSIDNWEITSVLEPSLPHEVLSEQQVYKQYPINPDGKSLCCVQYVASDGQLVYSAPYIVGKVPMFLNFMDSKNPFTGNSIRGAKTTSTVLKNFNTFISNQQNLKSLPHYDENSIFRLVELRKIDR